MNAHQAGWLSGVVNVCSGLPHFFAYGFDQQDFNLLPHDALLPLWVDPEVLKDAVVLALVLEVREFSLSLQRVQLLRGPLPVAHHELLTVFNYPFQFDLLVDGLRKLLCFRFFDCVLRIESDSHVWLLLLLDFLVIAVLDLRVLAWLLNDGPECSLPLFDECDLFPSNSIVNHPVAPVVLQGLHHIPPESQICFVFNLFDLLVVEVLVVELVLGYFLRANDVGAMFVVVELYG